MLYMYECMSKRCVRVHAYAHTCTHHFCDGHAYKCTCTRTYADTDTYAY